MTAATSLDHARSNIKTSVSSVSECSQATVQAVRCLLGGTVSKPVYDKSQKHGTFSGGKKTSSKNANAQKPAKVSAETTPAISRNDGACIAEDIVNGVIRALCDCTKDAIPQNGSDNARKFAKSSATPREVSLNRAPHARSTTKPSTKSSSCLEQSRNFSDDGIEALAECGLIAFDYLHRSRSLSKSQKPNPDCNIENGMLAYLGKLIALHRYNLAIPGLRLLKHILDIRIGSQSTDRLSPRGARYVVKTDEQFDLKELLCVDVAAADSSILSVIVSFQLLVLRSATAHPQTLSLDALKEQLSLHHNNSLFNIIQQLARSSGDTQRAALQLDKLSQIIFLICPKSAYARETSSKNITKSPSPDVCLWLQGFAFRCRLSWMELAGHSGDIDREVIQPFAKSFTSCCSAMSSDSNLDYRTLKESFDLVYNGIPKSCSTSSPVKLADNVALTTLLSQMKEVAAAGGTEADKAHIDSLLRRTATKSSISSAARCSSACRISAEKVKHMSSQNGNIDPDVVTDVLKMVEGELNGTSEEVNGVLSDVLRLRNFTTQFARSTFNGKGHHSSTLFKMIEQFRNLSFSSICLLLRFWPSTKENPSRALLISNAAASSIECVLWYLTLFQKLQIVEDSSKTQLVLDDCTRLLKATQEPIRQIKDSEAQKDTEGSMVLVRLSHAYFESYLKSKQENPDISTSSLQRSCIILEDARTDDKIKGNLLMKLDRLARLYYNLNEPEKARENLLMLIDTSCRLQVLPCSVDDPPASIYTIFNRDSQTKLLGDAMQLLLEVQARHRKGHMIGSLFWDDRHLESVHRGLLLEWQLYILSGWTASKKLWSYAAEITSPLANALFEIYQYPSFRSQRHRLALQILNLETDIADCFDSSILESAEQYAFECLGEADLDPCQYYGYLKPSLEIALAMRDTTFRVDMLERALARLSNLLEEVNCWDELKLVIGDTHAWFRQAEYLLVFLQATGYSPLQISLSKLILKARHLEPDEPSEGKFRVSVEFGLQLLRLGYSELGGIFFARASDLVPEHQRCVESQIEYHHGYAEYFLELGEHTKSHEHLDQAQSLSSKALSSSIPRRTLGPHAKVFEICRNADGLHLKSRLNATSGSFLEAFWCGVSEFNLLQSVWKSLENHTKCSKDSPDMKSDESSVQSLTDGLSLLSVSRPNQNQELLSSASIHGPRFWPLVPRLCRSAVHLSKLSYHGGSVQDAFYYLDQAKKIAELAKANHLLAKVLLCRGDLECRKGDLKAGWTSLSLVQDLLRDSGKTRESIFLHKSLGYFHHLMKDWESEVKEYDAARMIVNDLIQSGSIRNLHPDFQEERAHEAIEPTFPNNNHVCKGAARVRQVAKRGKKNETAVQGSLQTMFFNKDGYALIAALENHLNRLKAHCLLQGGDLKASSNLFSNLEEEHFPTGSDAEYRLLKSTLLLREAAQVLSTNAIFGMLTESAVSLPAAIPWTKQSVTKLTSSQEDLAGKSSIHHLIPSAKNRKPQMQVVDKFGDLLRQIIQTLASRTSDEDQFSSILELRKKASTLGTASFLLSAVQNSLSEKQLNPTGALPFIDIPQYMSSLRDQAITRVDGLYKETIIKTGSTVKVPLGELRFDQDYSRFYQEFSSSLPASWTVISITLDESDSHLHITRHRSHSKPFALRLPLERQNSEGPDEESFTFEEARSEVAQIIKLSDATVHAARTDALMFKKKGARSEWWAEREALDDRMHNLLLNLENMWLGGFRGIFCPRIAAIELASRFQKTFEVILEKHLPSRQRSQKRPNTMKVQLDPQISELFLDLAHLSDDPDDLEEELTDLFYFVIDVLQFNGEENAYDEIDFDSIIIETQDALRSFQEALSAIHTNCSVSHTILLLDKRLHCFPWECLSCLDGQSVSRAYSIAEIQERISTMRSRSGSKDHEGIYASNLNGSYILNPSQDLAKTQSRFEKELSGLCKEQFNWTGIIGRAPSESEFASTLCIPRMIEAKNLQKKSKTHEKSPRILLYLGHGSGAQYIRHRRIKQTRFEEEKPEDQAASVAGYTNHYTSGDPSGRNTNVSVALLFGCSSASLYDNFEFEPHGTPKSYMLAGSPALLGSLWDVTDGDLDKFAGGVLERWGLFEKGTFEDIRVSSGKARGKGKARAKTKDGFAGSLKKDFSGQVSKMSLSQAVAKSRGDCYLKYLNGAAMVVYGVPVFLDSD